MSTVTETDLLKACRQYVAAPPDGEEERDLRLWWNGQRERSRSFVPGEPFGPPPAHLEDVF